MHSETREEYINRKAYSLAASGAHIDCITIVSALVDEGYPEAREFLDSDLIRSDLRRICRQHWAAKGGKERPTSVPSTPPEQDDDAHVSD